MNTKRVTTQVTISANLDLRAKVANKPFKRRFSPVRPPDPESYDLQTEKTIYDGEGNERQLMVYFLKIDHCNAWQVHIAIDGRDISEPMRYEPARGYNLIFDSSGNYLPHQAAKPSLYYGRGLLSTQDSTVSNISNDHYFETGDLVINGETINAPGLSDRVSTIDNYRSSINIAAAINQHSENHGIFAFAKPNTLDLGQYHQNPASVELSNGMMILNGVPIIGPLDPIDPLGTIARYINETELTGVKACVVDSSLLLTAEDGRNIQVSHELACQGTFANFDMTSNERRDVIKTGSLILSRTPCLNTLTLPYSGNNGHPALKNLIINEIEISGDSSDGSSWVENINKHTESHGVLAIQSANRVILCSDQSQAIEIIVDGKAMHAQISSGHVSINEPERTLRQVIPSQFAYRMAVDDRITIGGKAPHKVGLEAGTLRGTVYTSSDAMPRIEWIDASDNKTELLEFYSGKQRSRIDNHTSHSFCIDLTSITSFPSESIVHDICTQDEPMKVLGMIDESNDARASLTGLDSVTEMLHSYKLSTQEAEPERPEFHDDTQSHPLPAQSI